MSRLYIAEKPSLAKAIAAGIGVKGRKDGYIECNNGDVVTWAFGHLLELCPPDHYDPNYKKWDFDHLPILPDEMVKQVKIKPGTGKPDPGALKQMKVIRTLQKKCSEVVNAGDPDREGQLLVDEILDDIGNKKPVKRIWLASLDLTSTKRAIDGVFDNSEKQSLRMAAETRSISDWLVGLNLTRAATLALKEQGGFSVLSIGRVQTPTLALVVNRELEIRNFKPRDYFTCIANLSHKSNKFKVDFKPEYNDNLGGDPEGYLVDKTIAEKALEDIKSKSTVLECSSKQSKSNQPKCYALSDLQGEGSKLGLGAKQTLDIAQKLYENGYTSYPRSDCGFLPEEQHGDAAKILSGISKILPIADKANPTIKSATWNSKKVGAHHGIIPTEKTPSGLSDLEMGVYRLICKRYVAQFFGPEIYDAIKVSVADASNHVWKASGKNVKDSGWRIVYGSDNSDSESIVAMSKGDVLDFIDGSMEASKTKPPSRFTEGALIKAMSSVHNFVSDPRIKKMLKENSGIGTEATRAAIIENLFGRKYMKVEKKKVVPSALGIFLVQSLAPRLVDPGITAVWEEYLKMIETGEMTMEDFIKEQKKFIPKWIEDIRKIDFPESIIKQFPKNTKGFSGAQSKKRTYKKKS